jgi:hypothetical protein
MLSSLTSRNSAPKPCLLIASRTKNSVLDGNHGLLSRSESLNIEICVLHGVNLFRENRVGRVFVLIE